MSLKIEPLIGEARSYYINRTYENYRFQSCMKCVISNLISDRFESIKYNFKYKMNIKRLTSNKLPLLNSLVKLDNITDDFRELYKKL